MKGFNDITSAVFSIVLAPLGHAWAGIDLVLWPVLAGVIALIVYKHVSNQKGITRAKNGIQVHLLEIVLYRDDLLGVLASTAKALFQNLKYLGFNIVPMLVMLLPMSVVLVQLVANYAYAPVPVGSVELVEVQLDRASGVKATDVTVDLPAGVVLDAPPVRTPEGKVVWRVRAEAEGDHVLTIHAGAETQEKGFAVGGGPRKVPVLRTQSIEAFLYPGEPALPGSSAIESITMRYPDRELAVLPDGEGGILAWFFVFSLAAGFALKDQFGVTL